MSLVQTNDPLEFSAYLRTPRRRRVPLERKPRTVAVKQSAPFEWYAFLVVASYVLSGHTPFTAKPTMREVLRRVADKHDVNPEDIKGPSRSKHLVAARKEAAYYMRAEAGKSSGDIGQFLGGRDHTTILHATDSFAKQYGLERPWRQRGTKGQ